jgi:hypothetical protein
VPGEEEDADAVEGGFGDGVAGAAERGVDFMPGALAEGAEELSEAGAADEADLEVIHGAGKGMRGDDDRQGG